MNMINLSATVPALSPSELEALNREIDAKAVKLTEPMLWSMFAFGFLIAFFYDTWLVAFGVGTLCLLAYFLTKKLLPGSNLYQYVLSAVCAIYAAQYIYQMHGMAEMHFWVFISSAILIIYQNWRLQLPLILIVIVHHGSFAYLQYIGYKEIYFTQLAYMDLKTFLFHGVLASGVCMVAAFWGHVIQQRTIQDAINYKALSSLKSELLRVNENLNNLVTERTEILVIQNKALVNHAYINAHKVRSPLARILGLVNLMHRENGLDEEGKNLLHHLHISANELDEILTEVRVELDRAEFKGEQS